MTKEEKLVVIKNGKRVSIQNKDMWQDYINATIPKSITQFFFFDGEKIHVRISLLPSATRFRAGDEIRLDIQGHWFHHRDPIHGQFPVGYHTDAKGTCIIHVGPDDVAKLSIPVLPTE